MANFALIAGTIPHNTTDADGAWHDVKSFTKARDLIVVCWNHWRGDDYVFSKKGYYVITDAGLQFTHNLDLTRPAEYAIWENALRGLIFLSRGQGATPGETMAAIANYQGYIATNGKPGKPYRAAGIEIGHIAYCFHPSCPQTAVKVICSL